MLYKLLIVDDEEVIRESLVNLVAWRSLGFDVVAKLEDGEDAIDYIEKMPVDIVLTDIKMTFKSGLELAKYIHENKPDIKVVIISGYKDFEYARQSANYNVMHYLLKPTSIGEINRLFTEIKDIMDKEREKRIQYEEALPLLREQFFSDLLMGALREKDQFVGRMKLVGLKEGFITGFCSIIVIVIENYDKYLESQWEYGKDGLYTAMRNFIQGGSSGIKYYAVINARYGMTILSISEGYIDETSFANAMSRYFNNIRDSIKKVFDMDISVKPRHIYRNMMELSKHYPGEKENIVKNTYNKDDFYSEENHFVLVEQQKLLMSYINAGNFEGVSNILDSIMEKFSLSDIRPVHSFVIDIFSMVSNKLKDIGIVLTSETKGRFEYQKILAINNVGELGEWCKSVLNDIMETVNKCRTTSEGRLIERAKEYIRENCNKEISQEDVANYVFISTVYLSRLFKQQTHENFIDYLVRLRMEKAVELLRNPELKTYEISLMVGYKSTKYFSRLFKSNTGYTPSEYRRNILKESEVSVENE